MQESVYYNNSSEMVFPEAVLRHVGQLVRSVKPIEGYRAIADKETNRTFAIVSDGYKLVQHQDVIDHMDRLCEAFPEYGEPSREVWLSNFGARMKCRWTFPIDFEIKPGDVVQPTLEAFASFDTSLAQRMIVGGLRYVCTNGMVVGKVLGDYKRKHTMGLNLDVARHILTTGMNNYSGAIDLWKSYAERNALMSEVTVYEALPFLAPEKEQIETEIHRQGKVLAWDEEHKEDRKVDINAWDMYNILTAEASHHVTDIPRQNKLLLGIAKAFN